MALPDPRSDAGRRGLAALLAGPARALVAVDLDGTLAPIVARPEDARPAPGAMAALTRLAGRVGQVAVVTGRPAGVAVRLAGLTAVPGLVVLGQYGADRWPAAGPPDRPHPGLAALRAQLPALLAAEGADLEDKGLSLVVHTRRAASPTGALARLSGPVDALARAVGLELHPGRYVLELRPPGRDKGRALRTLAADRSAVLWAGDDSGDLPAYDEVDRLRAAGTPGLLVCSDSDEAPRRLRERADLVVDGPAGVVELLRALADALG